MSTKSGIIDGLVNLHSDTMLTEPKLANALQVADRTIRRMVERGELPPPVLWGNRRLWKVQSIRQWFDRLAVDAQRWQARQQAEREKAEAAMTAL